MDELEQIKGNNNHLVVAVSEQVGQLLALGAVFGEQLRCILADDAEVREWFIGRLKGLKVRPTKSTLSILQREAISRGHESVTCFV